MIEMDENGVHTNPDGHRINLKNVKTYTLEGWKAEAVRLFGPRIEDVKFKCPACEETQSLQDFLDAGIEREKALDRFYFSCIGRWVKDRGCNWTLGGTLQFHKAAIDQGDKEGFCPVMEFVVPEKQDSEKS